MKKLFQLFFSFIVCSGQPVYAQTANQDTIHLTTEWFTKKSNSTILLRRPTIERLKTTAFYDPRLAKVDEIKNTFFRLRYDLPHLNKIERTNLKTTGNVFKHNSKTEHDFSNITNLPELPRSVSIDNGNVIYKSGDGSFLVSEIETKGVLKDYNGRSFKDKEIGDNISRFEDVEKTIHAGLFEVFDNSGYTPSKLLLDFNKQNGFQFDLHIFQSPDSDADFIRINELELRTQLYMKSSNNQSTKNTEG